MSEQPKTNEAKHTPGPWKWEEARHTGVYETSRPRTLVSHSVRQLRDDGKDLGNKHVLVCGARIAASQSHLIDAISLEIHGTSADEALIAAAPDLLAAHAKLSVAWEQAKNILRFRCDRDKAIAHMDAAMAKAQEPGR